MSPCSEDDYEGYAGEDLVIDCAHCGEPSDACVCDPVYSYEGDSFLECVACGGDPTECECLDVCHDCGAHLDDNCDCDEEEYDG